MTWDNWFFLNTNGCCERNELYKNIEKGRPAIAIFQITADSDLYRYGEDYKKEV